MKFSKYIAFFLALTLVFSSIGVVAVLGESNQNTIDLKGWRNVGIHAQEENVAPDKPSKLYLNEAANIYLSIDKPNKGEILPNGERETHYDLNGYSVKFYYDDDFFRLNSETPEKPLNYKLPFEGSDGTGVEGGVVVPSEGSGYFPYKHGAYKIDLEEKDGKTYQVVYATILYSGTWVPDRDVDWYNLCAVPVIPKKTGTTEVFVEVGTTDEFALELYSKNKPGEDRKNFEMTVVNNGYHTIVIEEQPKPASPKVTPSSGTYPEKQTITITAGVDCDIYYSLNGGAEQKYEGPFDITSDTTLVCYAKKTTGEMRESSRVTCNYIISAGRPYLIKQDKTTLVPDRYFTETKPYTVYFSDTDEYKDSIPDGTMIYYTFRQDVPMTKPVETATSPEEGWVAVANAMPELLVDETVQIRMFTDRQGIFSEVFSYTLGFSPEIVEAEDHNDGTEKPSGVYDEPLEIRLVSNPDAHIYYTTDGSDPIESNNRYDGSMPIIITEDTTIRAVAVVNGQFGPVMTYWYVINKKLDGYGVSAFYPSGTYEGEVTVILTPDNPDFAVRYKYDGDENWTDYNSDEPIQVTDDKGIIAQAVDKNGEAKGKEYEFNYIIMPKSPVFSPESTQFKSANSVTIYSPESTNENTDRFSVYYTIDGTWPVTHSQNGSTTELLDSPSVLKAEDGSDSAVIPIGKHTVITAVVVKDGTKFSHVIQHTYDVTKQKPTKPVTTLPEGIYTREIGTDEDFDFTTLFMSVPSGTEIYYTISDKGEAFCSDPVPGTTTNGTKHYDKNNPVPIVIEGQTIIKAVAVNRYGVKSDIALFEYTVIPQAPIAAAGGTVAGTELPVVPVKAVVGSTVVYKAGDFENRFECTSEDFYIDMTTGNAYSDPDDLNSYLGNKSDVTNNGSALLEIYAELDGVESQPNYYLYKVSGIQNDILTLAPPYADTPSGRYDEVTDEEDNLLVVRLKSINENAEIQYKLKDSSDWITYNEAEGVKIKNGDDVLYARCIRGSGSELISSEVVSYTYIFYPIAPYISLESGRYGIEENKQSEIRLDVDKNPHKPHKKYEIYHSQSGEDQDFPLKYDNVYTVNVNKTMSVKAYVKNKDTGRFSPIAIRYYIVETETAGGAVEMEEPYYGKTRVPLHLITQNPWNEGIKLYTEYIDDNVDIMYTYTRILKDGTPVYSKTTVYDPASPIAVTANTKSIQITAWLVNENGEITNTRRTFNEIEFESISAPLTSLNGKESTQLPSGTTYTIECDEEYKNDPKITRYYTTDGSDPVVYDSITGEPTVKGKVFTDSSEPLRLTANTTVKTVYRSACGNCDHCQNGNYDLCPHAIFGEIGAYRYNVVQSSGGGGGGGGGGGSSSSSAYRKYTKDIFGQEHPSHIGYIYGYLDGSVKPEGHITREETTAILYRIRNKQYEKPFETMGTVFPDVKRGRWSVTEIEYMANENVILGYPDGEFKPTKNLSRAEFAALICRFAKLDAKKKQNPFEDLKEKHWAYDEIMAVYENGLMQGYGEGVFAPENEITRAEVMTVVNKLLGRNPSEKYVKTLGFNPYNDLKEDKWYYVTVLEATITHDYYLDKSGVETKWENWR